MYKQMSEVVSDLFMFSHLTFEYVAESHVRDKRSVVANEKTIRLSAFYVGVVKFRTSTS